MQTTLETITALYPLSETPVGNAIGWGMLVAVFCLFAGAILAVFFLPAPEQLVARFGGKLTIATYGLIAVAILSLTTWATVASYHNRIQADHTVQVEMLAKLAAGKNLLTSAKSTGNDAVVLRFNSLLGEIAGKPILSEQQDVTIPLAIVEKLNEQVFQPKGVALAVNK